MKNISFSQSSLQDYLDCPRRFELRYLLKIRWPGDNLAEPDEIQNSAILGNRFHLLCQQFFSGVDENLIRQSIDDEILLQWWLNFVAWEKDELVEGQYHPEITLHTHLANNQVLAKYDLIQVHQSGIRIYDWKTSPTRYSRSWLEKKVQTTLYPLVICLAGNQLAGNAKLNLPENIEMVYWFAAHPQDPEIIPYSRYKYEEDKQYIEKLIEQIDSTAPGEFEMTANEKNCRFCNFRSLCERHPDLDLSPAEKDTLFESALEGLAAELERQLDEINGTW